MNEFLKSSASDFGLEQTGASDLHALARAGTKVSVSNARTQGRRPICKCAQAAPYTAGANISECRLTYLLASEDLASQ